MNRILASLSWALLLSTFSLCQPAASGTSRPSGLTSSMVFGGPLVGLSPVPGAPYSAEEHSEITQTLADGTHINRTMPVMKIYRDSMGRTRTERPVFQGVAADAETSAGPTIVEIDDPVAHVRYIFNPDERVVHRQQLPSRKAPRPIAARVPDEPITNGELTIYGVDVGSQNAVRVIGGAGVRGTQPGSSDPKRPQTTTEKLGTQTIEGVVAEGMRTTITWPAGSMGNDRPITSTREAWFSRELKMSILHKMDDPRTGERIRKLTNISRSEPDPSLFEPPPGYEVKNEKRPFTLNWGSVPPR